jgi:hypothetical protein
LTPLISCVRKNSSPLIIDSINATVAREARGTAPSPLPRRSCHHPLGCSRSPTTIPTDRRRPRASPHSCSPAPCRRPTAALSVAGAGWASDGGPDAGLRRRRPPLGRSLLRSIEVAHHAISVLPDSHDAISVHRLAPGASWSSSPRAADQGCCVHDFTDASISSGGRGPEEANACVEPVSFEAQLPPRPSTPVPSQDLMLIKARAPSPNKKITSHVSPRPLATATTLLKTYR